MHATDAPAAQVGTAPVAGLVLAVSLAGGILGAVLYGWIVFGILAGAEPAHFGTDIYDQAWLALREGRLDLPVRVIGFEGHYTADGTAHFYHGLGPLITRLALAPFVEIGGRSLAPVSIWFWSVAGTALYHLTFLQVARRSWPGGGRRAVAWSGLLAAAVWLGAPGLVLASNIALYHEPIAMAYALAAGVVALWILGMPRGRPTAGMVVGVALLAALCLHARPNLAIGLYVIAVAAIGLSLLRGGWRALAPVLAGCAMLGLGGVGYLGLNAARFGGATETHGRFDAAGVQYGSVFWGHESQDGPRAQGFIEHGRFNAARIVPNALLYTLAPAETLSPGAHEVARRMHVAATWDRVGAVRIEGPGGGILALWTIWAIAAGAGLAAGAAALRRHWALVLGTGLAAGVTLAYATVTLRYHVDLWPLAAALALPGLGWLVPRLATRPLAAPMSLGLVAAGMIGLTGNLTTAGAYRGAFVGVEGSFFAPWTEEDCRRRAAGRGFDPARIDEICRAPRASRGQRTERTEEA
ncbi:hypothetical protein [Rhodovulum sp.]|uniref:hypothetical protein n=1 Tax=Rhodovulum sp. TaxID=34009 RepID=UPI0017E7B5FF|nr:hypothetical protein [Rhodovulum sp.]HDR28999.1 hypothetical protein [Rhodovulum sp.]